MKFQLLFSLFFVFLVNSINSQTYKLEYAQKLSSQFNFVEAYPVWEDLSNVFLKKQKGDWEYLRQAAKAAEKSEQYEKALYWIKILVDRNKALAKDYPLYFSLLCINKKHSVLQAAVQVALERFPNDNAIQLWSNNISKINDANSKQSEYKVTNFRKQKKGEEFSAVPYKDGLILVSNKRNTGFINRIYGRTNQYFLDLIYISNPLENNKDNLWKEIKRTNSHDGPISFSADYSLAFVTSNQEQINLKNKIKYANLELNIYRFSEEKWAQTNLFKWNNVSYSCGHAVTDITGDLYFASNMPGGFGGSDLYKCKWNGSEFEDPINLGATINTPEDELFPFITDDGDLYFSSNGWPSQGGYDIFSSDFLTLEPENLGNPINTNADDFSFYINNKTGKGFISSNRENFKDQIFSISRPIKEIETSISVIACDNNPMLNVPIRISNISSSLSVVRTTDKSGKLNFNPKLNYSYSCYYAGDDEYAADSIQFDYKENVSSELKIQGKLKNQVIKIKIVDENNNLMPGVQLSSFMGGVFKSKYISNLTEEDIVIQADEFYSLDSIVVSSINFQAPEFYSLDSIVASSINFKDTTLSINLIKHQCGNTIDIALKMTKESTERMIDLGLILYDFDLYNLRPEGKIELDKLVTYLKDHPDVFVELQSHTDSRGTYEYNVWLAEQRSQSCVNYIISNGISSSQIIPKGYGERRLKNSCNDFTVCTEDEHQENRRTELHIKLTKDAIIDSSNLNSNLKINNSLILNDSIYFRVQLISSGKKIGSTSKIFRNLPIYEYEDKGLYKYCLAEKFNNIESSKQKALSLRLNGFPEAFIVVFKNDKRFK